MAARETPVAEERRLAAAYLRHMVELRKPTPEAAHEVRVLASDIEAAFHRDPALNPDAGAPVDFTIIETPGPTSLLEPLAVASLERGGQDGEVVFTFNREPTAAEMEAMRSLPPSPQIARDAQHFAERVILAELAVRLFRTLVLGNFVVAESPAAMTWLKDWIDGTLEGHGPLGGPMIWPEKLPFVVGLLRQWGFQPTPTLPPYVTRNPNARNGAQVRSPMPDPKPAGPAKEDIRALILNHLGSPASSQPDRVDLTGLTPEKRTRLLSALRGRYRLSGLGPDAETARTVGELVDLVHPLTQPSAGDATDVLRS